MRLRILAVGRGMPPAIRELVTEYTGRLAQHGLVPGGVELVEVAETRRFAGYQVAEACREEGKRLLAKRVPGGRLVVLDAGGEMPDSPGLARWLEQERQVGTAALEFAIGGPDGWDGEVVRQAHKRLSLGRITLPHMLVRVVLLEQLYRAETILHGIPYHR